MSAHLIRYPEMPKRMARHYECMRATVALELDLFGAVVSPSVEQAAEEYSWWPLEGPPPRAGWSQAAQERQDI